MTSYRQLVKAASAIFVFAALQVTAWLIAISPIETWEREHLYGWNYAFHLLFFFPLVLTLFDRGRAIVYGLGLSNLRRDLAAGLMIGLPPIVIPLLVGWISHDATPKVDTGSQFVAMLAFQVVFAGFAEEVLYRGFLQGTLNQVFGRSWRIGATSCGIGLPLTAVVFGAGHLLNPFNPFEGRYTLDWCWFLTAAGLGLVLGLLRERTEGIVVPAVVHFCTNFYLMLYAAGSVTSFAVACSYSISVFIAMWMVMADGKAKPTRKGGSATAR